MEDEKGIKSLLEELVNLTKQKKRGGITAIGEAKSGNTGNEWLDAFEISFEGISIYRRFIIQNHNNTNMMEYQIVNYYVRNIQDEPVKTLSPGNLRIIKLNDLSPKIIIKVKSYQTNLHCAYTIDFIGKVMVDEG